MEITLNPSPINPITNTQGDYMPDALRSAGTMSERDEVVQDTSTQMNFNDFVNIVKNSDVVKIAEQQRQEAVRNRKGGSFDEDVMAKITGSRPIPGEDDENKRTNLGELTDEISSEEFLNGRMQFFDNRIYRQLDCVDVVGNHFVNIFYPHFDYGSYVTDLYETPTSVENTLNEYANDAIATDKDGNAQPGGADDSFKDYEKRFGERAKFLRRFNRENYNEFLAARAFVHPYAILKLAGACGSKETVQKYLTYDRFNIRRFYEIDGDDSFSAHYSKTPTTTSLIRWGNESSRGKTPYSFQDFVFCKWWNKIENNRLITLRRYAAPVTDNIEFRDYDVISQSASDDKVKSYDEQHAFVGKYSNSPWTPLATAVTYFGEDTGNSLSEILSFSAGYNWEDLEADSDPIEINSTQNDSGNGTINPGLSSIMSGLNTMTKVLGMFSELNGDPNGINLDAAHNIPPDPYKSGPYENRILGPVNVIMNTKKRKRGLTFKGDGLSLTFDYIARPIAGVNNKAILLDLLSNMLVMSYASGTWFGGMWRYNADGPAVYPFKYGDAMNKLHKGELFGKNGAVRSLVREMGHDTKGIASYLPEAVKELGNLFKNALGALGEAASNLFKSKDEKETDSKDAFENSMKTFLNNPIGKGIQKAIAAKVMQGTTVPYIGNQRALLTGEPVGNWHLTIGNPMNPIAMIGNLICEDISIKFSDELGPDDFPIGFTATVKLSHGMGRDRDAIESMFNRGFGRIYALSELHKSTADGETKVDMYTGTGVNTVQGRVEYDEDAVQKYYGGGTRFIAKIQQNELANHGFIYYGDTNGYKFLKAQSAELNKFVPSIIQVAPWQMGYTLG